MSRTEHVAIRPTWICRVCGESWPCIPAKTSLLVEYHRQPTALSLYLGQVWAEACRDLSGVDFDAELIPRFIGWRR